MTPVSQVLNESCLKKKTNIENIMLMFFLTVHFDWMKGSWVSLKISARAPKEKIPASFEICAQSPMDQVGSEFSCSKADVGFTVRTCFLNKTSEYLSMRLAFPRTWDPLLIRLSL